MLPAPAVEEESVDLEKTREFWGARDCSYVADKSENKVGRDSDKMAPDPRISNSTHNMQTHNGYSVFTHPPVLQCVAVCCRCFLGRIAHRRTIRTQCLRVHLCCSGWQCVAVCC